MSNLTDALIAAKLIGAQGGGSGGGSGLPEISKTESIVLETQTITFTVDENGTYANLSIDGLEVGTEYSVIYDGVTYSGLVAKDYDGEVYIGNLAMWGGTDTEEPFIIQTSDGDTTIHANNTNPTHEVGISSTVYTPANGSTLQVDGGEWKAVPSKGSELPEYGWQGAAIRWSNDLKWDAMPVAYVLYMEPSGDSEGYDVFINNPDVQDRVTFQTVYSLVYYNFMVPNIIMESYNFGHIVSIDEQASTITVRFEDANGPTFYILRADPDTGELHGYASQTN